jgi:signal transduction histidine kinase
MESLPRLRVLKSTSLLGGDVKRITGGFEKNTSTNHLTRDQMSKAIDMIPVIMCLVDSNGNIRHYNNTFKKAVNVSTFNGGDLPSISEFIVDMDANRFHRAIKQIITSQEPIIETIRNCATMARNAGGGGEVIHANFDWSLSVNGETNDYIILTGTKLDSMSLPSIRSSPAFCKLNERESTLYLRPSSSLLSIGSDDLDGIRAQLSSHEWDTFVEKVEIKAEIHKDLSLERKTTTALRETLETKRMFVRSVSHEIRTPLNVVFSGLCLFQDTIDLSPENMSLMVDIKFSCTVAIDILNDLLMYEKLESNVAVSEKSLCDINTILQSVYGQFQVQSRHCNINFRLEGDVMHYIETNIDTNKVRQVVTNLVSNAMKFTPAGGTVVMHVQVKPLSRYVRIEVRDTGHGISKV